MANNDVLDLKPDNNKVSDIKPLNGDVIDLKPGNISVLTPTQIYTDTRTVQAGQIMTTFPLLTYPTAGTFTNAVRL